MTSRIEPPGLSLIDAIRHFATPEEWQAYQRVGSFVFQMIVVGGAPDPHEAARARDDVLCRRAECAVLDRLISGELVATAMQIPLTARSERVTVAAAVWSLLRVIFERSSAEGHGLSLFEIKVFHAPDLVRSAAMRRAGATEAERAPTRSEIRVMIWHEIEAEMRQRAADGKLTGHITADCRHIAAAVEKRLESNPHVRSVPSARSIENKLRELYRRLMQETDA